MPSPFPGMDPYIEASGDWGDFHASLLVAIKAKLNELLPRRYRARVDVFVFIQVPHATRRRRVEPDVFVVERPERRKPTGRTAAVAAPMKLVLPAVKRTRRKSVLIVDRQMHQVVTAIEILSPSNKEAGEDRTAYLFKRNQYLANRVNLVELDLLRGGARLPLGNPPPRVDDYYVAVCRAWEYPKADLWNLTLRDPLPRVPVPLAADVPEVILPLRDCVDRAYEESSYDTELDYDQTLTPRPARRTSPGYDGFWLPAVPRNRPPVKGDRS